MNFCLDLLKFLRTEGNVVIEGKIPDPMATPEDTVQALTEDEQPIAPSPEVPAPAPEQAPEQSPEEKHAQYKEALLKEFNVDLDQYEDKMVGGLGDKKNPCDFPLEALVKGIRVELEHSECALQALEITIDHLTEKADYYEALEQIEAPAPEQAPEGTTDQVQKQAEEEFLVTEGCGGKTKDEKKWKAIQANKKAAKKKNEGKAPEAGANDTDIVQSLTETFEDGQTVKVKNEGLKSGFEYAGQTGIVEDVPSNGNYVGVRMSTDRRLRYFFPDDLISETDVASDLQPSDEEKLDAEATAEDAERRKEIEQQSGVNPTMESKVNEDVTITAEELLTAVKSPENARMYGLVTNRAKMLKQEGTLSMDRAIGLYTNLVQPIAHMLYINKTEGLAEGALPYDAVVAQVAKILAQEILGTAVKESEEEGKKPEEAAKAEQPTGEDDKNKEDNKKIETEPEGTSLDTEAKKIEIAPEVKDSAKLTDQEEKVEDLAKQPTKDEAKDEKKEEKKEEKSEKEG